MVAYQDGAEWETTCWGGEGDGIPFYHIYSVLCTPYSVVTNMGPTTGAALVRIEGQTVVWHSGGKESLTAPGCLDTHFQGSHEYSEYGRAPSTRTNPYIANHHDSPRIPYDRGTLLGACSVGRKLCLCRRHEEDQGQCKTVRSGLLLSRGFMLASG